MAYCALTTAAKNARLTALVAAVGSGAFIRFYSGPMPATPDTALAGNTQLCVLTCSSPFGTVSNGVLTIPLPTNATGQAAGLATWARVTNASSGLAIIDMDVGATGSGASIILTPTSVVVGELISASASATISEL